MANRNPHSWSIKFAILGVALALVCLPIHTASADNSNRASSWASNIDYAAMALQQNATGWVDDAQSAYLAALMGTGTISTFISEPFYDGTIESADDALAAVESVIDRIGGDETTRLVVSAITHTDTVTYYSLRQQAGDVFVYGAAVKLIVDNDGTAIGLVSSIMPKVQLEPMGNWAIAPEQAEEAVLEHYADARTAEIKLVPSATEQTVIQIRDGWDRYQYAWVVYTNNFKGQTEMAYLAHYVSEDGEYLYCIPVAEPGNADALAGSAATFAFMGLETNELTKDVKTSDGALRSITIPVLTNPATGATYLGDGQRMILCADYADFVYRDTLTPCELDKDTLTDDELLTYDRYIQIWDLYDSMGWQGPDGRGTPTLLLMNYVDEDGNPVSNACYSGRIWGFQVFAFSSLLTPGECTDIVAHEFTHCVTGTTMTTNLYLNDYGAINEGMSDIMGNLAEIAIDRNPDYAWLMGENAGEDGPFRSMHDPETLGQPEAVWDVYYVPSVSVGSTFNDQGGVHTNSSLLNIVSFRLDEAGMAPGDQFYYWFNVAFAMTPHTDFEQLAELLPWCMAQAGFPEYVDVITAAIDEAGYTNRDLPDTPPEGCGFVKFRFPDKNLADSGSVYIAFVSLANSSMYATWPAADTRLVAAALPEGDYMIVGMFRMSNGDTTVRYATKSQWLTLGPRGLAGIKPDESTLIVHVEDGKTSEIAVPSVQQNAA